jgi:glycosyltransferase involved in cell wall biosynthesis
MTDYSPRTSLLLHSSSDLYGASKILLTTVRTLKEKGEKIQVVLSDEGPLADALREEGVNVHIIRLGILRRKYFNVSGLFNRFTILKKAFSELVALAKRENVTHIYSNTSAVLIGAFVAKELNVYHTWHIHEIITHPKWFASLIGKIVNRYSDLVLVVSEAVKVNWDKYISSDKLKVIHNGIDYTPYLSASGLFINNLPIKPDTLIIGMIGRINAWKGQPYFLEIASKISESYPQVHFVMVGDVFPGDEHLEAEMHQKISSLKLTEKVSVFGFRNDIADILAALDIFILPSIQPDPLPTVVLEAMASGKPVVATAHGGACEMVADGKTGILIPWDDAGKSAKKVVPLLTDKPLRSEFGLHGRKRVLEHFSLEAFGDRMAGIFEQAYKRNEGK